MQSSECR